MKLLKTKFENSFTIKGLTLGKLFTLEVALKMYKTSPVAREFLEELKIAMDGEGCFDPKYNPFEK